jgi:acetyl esterase/lipase
MKNDLAYANRDFIPGADAIVARWEEDALTFRQTEAALGRARLNVAYGAHDRERLDIFHPAGPAKGLVVFVHGGYWHLFDRGWWSHLARGATARGWAVAIPSYVLAPEVRISSITRQISAAVTAAAAYVDGPIRLTGHSAGGHLAARMANADVGLSEQVTHRIDRIMPISPLADLRPLIETSMNSDLQLDKAEAVAESPALQPKALDVRVTVWVGTEERPAFLDQARWLSEAWRTELRFAPGRHHFDVIDGLEEAESPMMTSLLG